MTKVGQSREALHRFPAALRTGWLAADRSVRQRLQQQTTDIAALVTAAQALAQSGTDSNTPATRQDAQGMSDVSGLSADDHREKLDGLVFTASALLQITDFPGALATLAQCQALAAA